MAIAESTHWYQQDGQPLYEVEKVGGGLRPTTLRDARKLNLVPSVTEIIKVAAKPALTNWLIEQAYMAMATLPEIAGESIDDRIKRAKTDAQDQASKARDLGTEIHASLERYFMGKWIQPSHQPYIDGVVKKLNELFGEQEWKAETPFAHPLGYGGKLDLHCDIAVVDFKTKDFDSENIKKMAYADHGIQLDAYRHGVNLSKARMVNLFVSTKDPGLVVAEEHTENHYFEMFQCLLKFWQLQRQYDSSF